MGSVISTQNKILTALQESSGKNFPGSDYKPPDRKNWMANLTPEKTRINQILWPGTHNSATNGIGFPLITRPFAECQSLSIYEQLVLGTRVLDIRIQQDRLVCHGIILSHNNVDVVLEDVKKFLSETQSEIIILEIRTEFGYEDPPEFDKYLVEKLGDYLIHQDDHVFEKTITDLLPKRVICFWRPKQISLCPKRGDPLWNGEYLGYHWIDTDLPLTKFDSNIKHLSEQTPVLTRKYFYIVGNTLTPKTDRVKPLSLWINKFGRLFISQCVIQGIADKLQIFSTDFIDEDFVDACAGFTSARIQGKA